MCCKPCSLIDWSIVASWAERLCGSGSVGEEAPVHGQWGWSGGWTFNKEFYHEEVSVFVPEGFSFKESPVSWIHSLPTYSLATELSRLFIAQWKHNNNIVNFPALQNLIPECMYICVLFWCHGEVHKLFICCFLCSTVTKKIFKINHIRLLHSILCWKKT